MADLQKTRNLGSNFTTFRYAGKNIAYLEMVADSGQQAVPGPSGQPYEFIHPLGYRNPQEIVTSRAMGGGTITLTIRELWHQEIWQQMSGLANAYDIVGVFEALANQNNYVTCTKIITPPSGKKYGKTYHRCVVVQIEDGETFQIGSMSLAKSITVAYTHTTPL